MIGIDLVYLPEFKQQLTKGGQTFINKAFNPSEQKDDRIEHLAGLWAAKEAVIKASDLSAGDWLEINITSDGTGKPTAIVGDNEYAISITHHGDYAVAVALNLDHV